MLLLILELIVALTLLGILVSLAGTAFWFCITVIVLAIHGVVGLINRIISGYKGARRAV
jgi:hypothetical protein